MPQPRIRLAIIFVLYRTYREFERFLDEQGQIPDEVRLIVVDNTLHASINHERHALWKQRYKVDILIAEPENLGYFGAGRYALDRLPDLYEYDYIGISNTDVLYRASDVHEVLRVSASEHKGVGAIAPRLIHSDGSPRRQFHYLQKPALRKYRRLARLFSIYPLGAAHRIARDLKTKLFPGGGDVCQRQIFAPHGAFMLMTQAYFGSTGGFSHPCFLFNEEIYVGHECENSGLTCIFEPRITYSHDNHGSMGFIPSRRLIMHLHDAHEAVLAMLK